MVPRPDLELKTAFLKFMIQVFRTNRLPQDNKVRQGFEEGLTCGLGFQWYLKLSALARALRDWSKHRNRSELRTTLASEDAPCIWKTLSNESEFLELLDSDFGVLLML